MDTLPQNTGFARVSASAGQTAFAFSFPILAADQVEIIRVRAGAATVLDLTVDYSVAGAGVAEGFTVTLTTAALAGDVLAANRVSKAERVSARFRTSGDFIGDAINAELDRETILAQEARRDIGRSLRAGNAELPLDPLPAAADRAGKLAEYDRAGQPTANRSLDAALAAVAETAVPDRTIASVGAAQSLPWQALKALGTVFIRSFYEGSFYGGGYFTWTDTPTAPVLGFAIAGHDDSAGSHGAMVRIVINGMVNSDMAGGTGDLEQDDTVYIRAASVFAAQNGYILQEVRPHAIKRQLVVANAPHRGVPYQDTYIFADGWSPEGAAFLQDPDGAGIVNEGAALDFDAATAWHGSFSDVTIRIDAPTVGILLANVDGASFDGLRVYTGPENTSKVDSLIDILAGCRNLRLSKVWGRNYTPASHGRGGGIWIRSYGHAYEEDGTTLKGENVSRNIVIEDSDIEVSSFDEAVAVWNGYYPTGNLGNSLDGIRVSRTRIASKPGVAHGPINDAFSYGDGETYIRNVVFEDCVFECDNLQNAGLVTTAIPNMPRGTNTNSQVRYINCTYNIKSEIAGCYVMQGGTGTTVDVIGGTVDTSDSPVAIAYLFRGVTLVDGVSVKGNYGKAAYFCDEVRNLKCLSSSAGVIIDECKKVKNNLVLSSGPIAVSFTSAASPVEITDNDIYLSGTNPAGLAQNTAGYGTVQGNNLIFTNVSSGNLVPISINSDPTSGKSLNIITNSAVNLGSGTAIPQVYGASHLTATIDKHTIWGNNFFGARYQGAAAATSVLLASAVALTAGVPTEICHATKLAGRYLVSGRVYFKLVGATIPANAKFKAGISVGSAAISSLTHATIPTEALTAITDDEWCSMEIPGVVLDITATTGSSSFYLVAQISAITSGSVLAYGQLTHALLKEVQ